MPPLVKRKSVTIGAGLIGYIYVIVKEDISGVPVEIVGISFNNDTRPEWDPRPAFAWKGDSGSLSGNDSSDGILMTSYVCSYGDATRWFAPKTIKLGTNEQIGFKFVGENGDVCNAKVFYNEVNEDG
jgi:hypothetical protein